MATMRSSCSVLVSSLAPRRRPMATMRSSCSVLVSSLAPRRRPLWAASPPASALQRPFAAACSFSTRSTAAAAAASADQQSKTVLILGSSGCLGSSIVSHLSSKKHKTGPGSKGIGVGKLKLENCTLIGADCVQPPPSQMENDLLDAFIPLPHPSTAPSLGKITRELCLGLKELDDLSGPPGKWYDGSGQAGSSDLSGLTLDAIICASGGWEGDPPTPSKKSVDDPTDDWETNLITDDCDAHSDVTENMLRMNLYPVLAAGRAMDRYMSTREGLFLTIGAAAALAPTPSMYAYGLSKAAVHHYIQTLGASSGPKTGIGHKAQRKKATTALRRDKAYLDDLTALSILPSMIDTPNNRKFAEKGADFDDWTKPEDIAKEIETYLHIPSLRPNSGALIKVFPDKKRGKGAMFTLVR